MSETEGLEAQAQAVTSVARKEMTARSSQTEGVERPPSVTSRPKQAGDDTPPEARAFRLAKGQFAHTAINAMPSWYLTHLVADQTQDGLHWNDLDLEQRTAVQNELRRRRPSEGTPEISEVVRARQAAELAAVEALTAGKRADEAEAKQRQQNKEAELKRLEAQAEQLERAAEAQENMAKAAREQADIAKQNRDRAAQLKKELAAEQEKAKQRAEEEAGEGEDGVDDADADAGDGVDTDDSARTKKAEKAVDGTVDEVATRVAKVKTVEDLDAIELAEKAGKGRAGVQEAIDKRRAELDEEADEE